MTPGLDSLEDLGEGPDLGLGEEPESLLNYLRAQRKRVARKHIQSMPGLPLCMEMMLHDCLIYQLDREPNCHRSRMSDLRDQLSKWTEQAR